MVDIINPESIEAYRNRVMVYSMELWQEKEPKKRINLLMYLADAVTTLTRLENEALKTQQKTSEMTTK